MNEAHGVAHYYISQYMDPSQCKQIYAYVRWIMIEVDEHGSVYTIFLHWIDMKNVLNILVMILYW